MAWSFSVPAFDAIPNQSGFSGYLLLGASFANTSSNMLAGTKTADLTYPTTDSLTSAPASRDSVSATVLGEARYTFAAQRTQLVAGQLFTDYVRYDVINSAGVRHEIESLGTMGVSYVFSGIAAKVWKDPYVVAAERIETDRKQQGWRLSWERMFATPVSLQYTLRAIEMDELSGKTQLALNEREASLLDRNADLHELRVWYEREVNERHRLTPELIYDNNDANGQAMAAERYGIKLTHTFVHEKFGLVLITSGSYTHAEYNALNPIYNETRSDKRYGIDFTYLQFGLFKNYPSQLALAANLYYFNEDANINFYDSRIYGVTLALLSRF